MMYERRGATVIRTQIQLTESQAKNIQELALKQGISMAELIRRSVDQYIKYSDNGNRMDLISRAKEASGKYRIGPGDLAEQHDLYLAEDFHK
jgi:hypothetical protein